jgi:hypothetical protein
MNTKIPFIGNNTCIINPPHHLTQKCQNWANSPTLEVQLHQLPSRNITNIESLLHTKHLPLPNKWHFCIHSTMSYVFITMPTWFVILCVYPWINCNEKNKFIIYQSSARLHFHYHRQIKQHSNWPKYCQPWILWSLD